MAKRSPDSPAGQGGRGTEPASSSLASISAMTMPLTAMSVGAGSMPVRVRAAFRLERLGDVTDASAKTAHHVFDHVIAADEEPLGGDRRRQMAVADVPGDAGERGRIRGADLGERLRRRPHRDRSAILEDEAVAVTQEGRLRQIEQELDTAFTAKPDSPAMTKIMVKLHGIVGHVPGRCSGQETGDADHASEASGRNSRNRRPWSWQHAQESPLSERAERVFRLSMTRNLRRMST